MSNLAKVKHTSERGEETVHVGRKGENTKCGIFAGGVQADHWENVGDNARVTCDKNGCKN